MNHRNNFDLLRLFAACQVMFSHICGWLYPGADYPMKFLFSVPGVAIFFVISGFLVSDSFIRSPSVGGYFVKRSLRIYPALAVNILVMELALAATGSSQLFNSLKSLSYFAIYMLTGSRYWAVDVASYDTYTMLGFFKPYYPSGVLWTITVELSFYLVLPVFLEIWRRWSRLGVALIVGAALLSWVMSRHFNLTDKYDEVISTTIAPHFWIFALGVLARLHWDGIREAFEEKAVWWLAGHALFTAATSVYLPLGSVTPATPIDGLRIIVLAGLVLSAAYSFPKPDLLRKQDLSYGIYLYHMLVIHTLLALGFVGQWWLCLITPVAVIALAALSWWLVEKPAMKLRTSLVTRRLSVA